MSGAGGRSNKGIMTGGESWYFGEQRKPLTVHSQLERGLIESETVYCVPAFLIIGKFYTR